MKLLSSTKFVEHTSPSFYHGRLLQPPPRPPTVTWSSKLPPRKNHNLPKWLTATEYKDSPEVLKDKVKALAELMVMSRRTVVYSGAGISTAAGVGQAARGAGARGGAKKTRAHPTVTHLALAQLERRGLIQGWVQQNHDGLPQKAGYPQEKIVEIHGSWYDPSNPVVKYSGDLRGDLYEAMQQEAEEADLVLVMGTSLSGLNSDQVVEKAAERSLTGSSLGSVIINLQQTVQDGKSSLRMFAETDVVMAGLLDVFGIHLPNPPPRKHIPAQRALVPYDSQGCKSDSEKNWLDLHEGQKIILNPNHNCQGSGQPGFLHIKEGEKATGHVVGYNDEQGGWDIVVKGKKMRLGGWWMEAATRGGPLEIPVLNK